MTNGEKYKSIDERGKVFWSWMKAHCHPYNGDTCCEGCPLYDMTHSDAMCAFAWLNLEAEEEVEDEE